jgi:hypothetical protein
MFLGLQAKPREVGFLLLEFALLSQNMIDDDAEHRVLAK